MYTKFKYTQRNYNAAVVGRKHTACQYLGDVSRTQCN